MAKLELTLQRTMVTDKSTIGVLKHGDSLVCYTLEDVVRAAGIKIQNATAIPPGVYQVRMTWSNRFQKVMPLLMDVPGFAGIRIHAGNTAQDTEGCILLGEHRAADRISSCKPALDKVHLMIAGAERDGGTWITVKDVIKPQGVNRSLT